MSDTTRYQWIGKIPDDWHVLKISHTTYVKGRIGWHGLNTDDFIDEGAYCVTGTDLKDGIIDWSTCYHVSEERYNQDPFIQLKEEDLLLTKDGTIGKCGIVVGLEEKATLNSGLFVIRPEKDSYITRFLYWIIQSQVFDNFITLTKTGTTISHLYQNVFEGFRFPVPKAKTQKQIADFLDKETTRIDTLIAKKQKQIELLQEKRQAIITQSVTKGLNPDVKMKDSGVEWIGEIPEHWGVVKIRHLTLVKRGASPRPIDDPIYFDDEGKYSWVRIADVTASSKYLETTTQRLSELGSSLSVKLKPGKLFLSIAGSVGKPMITRINCCIHDGFVYFPSFEENYEFLYYIFLSSEPFGGLGKMGTQLNLNTDTVGDIKIPLPTRGEQGKIVKFLIDEIGKNQLLIEKVQRSINLLKEYHSSLITHAVSGQIDISKYEVTK